MQKIGLYSNFTREEKEVIWFMWWLLPKYLEQLWRTCNPTSKLTEIDKVRVHNPFKNMTGICNTVVLSYIFADFENSDEIGTIIKNADDQYNAINDNPACFILNNVVKLFYENNEISESQERKMPQINLLLSVCPSYFQENSIIPIALSQYYKLKIWDGDKMITLPNSAGIFKKKMIFMR